MKLDFDNFRSVLEYLDENPNILGRDVRIDGLDYAETQRYLGFLKDEGLIEANQFANKTHGTFYYPTRITLNGYKFLDGASTSQRYDKAKKAVGGVATAISIIEIIKFVIESSQ